MFRYRKKIKCVYRSSSFYSFVSNTIYSPVKISHRLFARVNDSKSVKSEAKSSIECLACRRIVVLTVHSYKDLAVVLFKSVLYFLQGVSRRDALYGDPKSKSVIKYLPRYSYADLDTWRVGGRVQGDRRHRAAVAAGDRVLMGMLMMRMMAGERLRLLVRGIIGVERFVACHQRVQHLEHHFRRRDGADVAAAAAPAVAAAAAAGR